MTPDPCHTFEDFIKSAHTPDANAQSQGSNLAGEFFNQSKQDPLIGPGGLMPAAQEEGLFRQGFVLAKAACQRKRRSDAALETAVRITQSPHSSQMLVGSPIAI
jgi:hypothetical protein